MAYRPRFSIGPRLLMLLGNVQALEMKIASASVSVQWKPVLESEALLRTAHGTAAIEGNPLTLEEVRTVLSGQSSEAMPHRAVRDIKNVSEMLRAVEKLKQANLTEPHVFQLHRILAKQKSLERGPTGTYRTYGVEVGHHKGAHPSDVPLLMKDLLAWVADEGAEWPAIVTSAILHFQFEFIHPFGDGNGRVGRAIALQHLYHRTPGLKHIFSVDEVLWKQRSEYYAALHQAETNHPQDLSSWIEFMTQTLLTAFEQAWERIQLFSSPKQDRNMVFTHRQELLVKHLRETQMTIQQIQKALQVTKPGAHYVLKPLLTAKIIERIGGHRTGAYRLRR